MVTISKIIQSGRSHVARSDESQRGMTLKEALSKVLWAIQGIGKSRRVSILDQAPQELATSPPHVQQGPSDTVCQTCIPESMLTPTTATQHVGEELEYEVKKILDSWIHHAG